MEVVNDLVLAPFKDIVQQGSIARDNANAGDNEDMLSESQKLIRGAERILKLVEPMSTRLWEVYGHNFIDALKENDDIASYRSQLNGLLWDFEDFIESDDFDHAKYIELQVLCKTAGLDIAEILKRMKLQPVVRDHYPISDEPQSPASASTVRPLFSHPDFGGGLNIYTPQQGRSPSQLELVPSPFEPDPCPDEITQDDASTSPEISPSPIPPPPPPPAADPWDLKSAPPHDLEGDVAERSLERRSPMPPSPSDSSLDPMSPPGLEPERRATFPVSPRRLDVGVDYLCDEQQRLQIVGSPEMCTTPPDGSRQVMPFEPGPYAGRSRSYTLGIDPGAQRRVPPPRMSATILPSRQNRPYSIAESDHSNSSRQRSGGSMQSSVFDETRNEPEGSASPAMMDHPAAARSFPENPDSITGAGGNREAGGSREDYLRPVGRTPTIPPNFPPGVEDGIEAVPIHNDRDGLIPVNEDPSAPAALAVARPIRQLDFRDCTIGSKSSFYLYKGFCEGAKSVMRGEAGVRRSKRPGMAGSQPVARCLFCMYDLDYHKVEMDLKGDVQGGHTLQGISYRMRFLRKSHISTKRNDEFLYGCIFCVHSNRTLDVCDATVFFSAKQLFKHLARHPRPLPEVPGITVVDEHSVPAELTNNFDLHFKRAPVPSPLEHRRDEVAQLPTATVTKTVKKMYGMRRLSDQTPVHELAEGARISGVEFPAKYRGEWVTAWHDGEQASVPFDIVRLDPPPMSEIRMGAMSHATATARWKFAPKSKEEGEEWLKFEKGEEITNISWLHADHWCWSGTNSKGKWGIFPQAFIEPNTVKEPTRSNQPGRTSEERRRTKLLSHISILKGSAR
ncbi:hypothetical protein SODALDRAFT_306264 [Sodiomyces alkalinus F11]|uniref:SH3 domain-containing protein n=1 Tax=Sodiomyces alkalinus (strain CBS 110278 / VKM F-3762 / F11) TaxID=1314773 RepID=A0A3N2Q0I5_SODAK|nr:hypothetical protein SODALDRAFT_306264 [Sodiomyces alkalinus F11]ROT40208.1 hypothetical protein SODALDRAFT_306264 [Sodiomyces alkalinus F11]